MEKQSLFDAYILKVNKTVFIIMCMSIPANLVQSLIHVYSNFAIPIGLSLFALVSLFLFKKKVSPKFITLNIVIALIFTSFVMILDFNTSASAIALGGAIFIGLYLNKRYIFAYGLITLAFLIYLLFFKSSLDMTYSIFNITIFIFGTVAVYYTAKWGKDLIMSASEKEIKVI